MASGDAAISATGQSFVDHLLGQGEGVHGAGGGLGAAGALRRPCLVDERGDLRGGRDAGLGPGGQARGDLLGVDVRAEALVDAPRDVGEHLAGDRGAGGTLVLPDDVVCLDRVGGGVESRRDFPPPSWRAERHEGAARDRLLRLALAHALWSYVENGGTKIFFPCSPAPLLPCSSAESLARIY